MTSVRIRKYAALALLAGCGMAHADVATQGTVIYRCDFADRGAWKAKGGWKASADGKTLCKPIGSMGVWHPLGVPDLAGKVVSVCFDVRQILPKEGDQPSGHWGLASFNEAGDRTLIFSRGRGAHLVISSASGQSLHGDDCKGRENVVSIRAGETSDAWTPMRIAADGTGLRIFLNGQLQRSETFLLPPLKDMQFHSFGPGLEIRNFRIVEHKVDAADFADAPTLVRDDIVPPQTFAVPRAVSSAGGAVMFWSLYAPGSDCVQLLDANDRVLASFYDCADFRIQANVAIEGSAKPLVYKRRLNFETERTQEETVHYAFTWGPDGKVRFFLNGIPFSANGFVGEEIAMPISGNLLDRVVKVRVPNAPRHLKQEIRDLKVYRRPLANHEVLAEYRRRMPIDLVMQDSLLDADTPVRVPVSAAPGGTYMQPHPVAGAPLVRATVDFDFRIERQLGRFRGEPIPGGVTVRKGVEVSGPIDITTEPIALPAGKYRLVARVNGYYTRTLFFSTMKPIATADRPASKEKWKKTDLLFDRSFAKTNDYALHAGSLKVVHSDTCGTYVECGSKGSHAYFDRAATVVHFPTNVLGKPCLLEFTWPDDKPRALGLTMHAPHKGPQGRHRDSLMAGILAGAEYRNRQELRTTEYLFFPAATNYLFELRTIIRDRPAAIARFRAFRLAEPLPRLKIHYPEGLPHRRFGHQDEDQTFGMLLNGTLNGGTAGNLSELLRYFDYTGESAFQYSFVRYTSTFGSIEGSSGTGMFPGKNGEFGSVLRVFNQHDIEFTGQFCLMGEPHVARFGQIECDWRQRGFISLDCDGHDRGDSFRGDYTANIANTELQDLYFTYFEDVLVRNAKAGGFRAVEIPVTALGSWGSPELGYDDWTVRRFASDCGITDPKLTAAALTSADYRARYDLLWKGRLHAQWTAWRAARVTEFFARLVAFIRARCPNIKIYLTLPGDEAAYEQRGIDVAALMTIDGVKVSLGRGYLSYFWHLFRNYNKTDILTRHYDPSNRHIRTLMSKTGAIDLVRCGQAYFESFMGSLDQKNYCAYFQSLDAKPVGRDWLKELAYCVGIADAQELVIGNQQLSTLGVEDMAREFVQAYSALPERPFREIRGSDIAQVVGRCLPTERGTYFYLVNETDAERIVQLDYAKGKGFFGGLPQTLDLSTDRTFKSNAFVLKPYELRSFFVPGRPFVFGSLATR